MFDFHEKRKIRRVLYSKATITVLFLLTLFIGRSVYERYVVERETALKLEERVVELEQLKQRASLLESKVEHLKNERGIEEEIRSRFDVAREGEQVIVILDEDADEEKSEEAKATTSEEDMETQGFFEKLKFW